MGRALLAWEVKLDAALNCGELDIWRQAACTDWVGGRSNEEAIWKMTEQIAAMEKRLLNIGPSSFRLAGRSFHTRGDKAQDPPVHATCGDEASGFLAEAFSRVVDELTPLPPPSHTQGAHEGG